MLPAETITTFFAASLLLGIAPGPDNVFVLTQSALYGRNAGLFVTLGLCSGLVLHSLAVALGVAALLQTSAVAFAALKYLGAAYLIYLAWQAFRAKPAGATPIENCATSSGRLYRRGILMNVTNPKVSIFFLAFLPQFADPARGSVTIQILLLGGLFMVATLLVFGTIAILAGSLSKWFLQSDRVQTVMNRMAGVVFLGIALKLATSSR